MLVTYTASGHDFSYDCLIKNIHTHKSRKEGQIEGNKERKKIGEMRSVIGLAVDGGLEACVKPGALTAGFKERGKGYGLESGLYFIF